MPHIKKNPSKTKQKNKKRPTTYQLGFSKILPFS
jgi:hypothetical protein